MIDRLKPYPAYKESGVPWLGPLPDHWCVRRLRNAAEMRVSNVDKHSKEGERPVRLCNYVDVYKNDRIRERMAFMRATATPDEISRFRLNVGDVLVTKDSETWTDIGVPALVEGQADDLICGYHLALLRPFPNQLLGAYLFRALQSAPISYQFHVEANGVTRYGLSHAAIKSISIPIPQLSDQAAIVRFLGHADRRIRRYIRAEQTLIALLEEQKQAIIHRAVTRGLDPNVRVKPSGVEWLGDVPEHWEVRRIASFSPTITNGWVGPTRDILRDAGVPYVQSLHIKSGEIRFDGRYFVAPGWLETRPKIRLQRGDVVVVQTGDIGQVACVSEVFDGAGCHALIIIRTDARVMMGPFLDLVLRSRYGNESLCRLQTGALLPHLNCTWVREIVVPVPPLAEQERILSCVNHGTTGINRAMLNVEHRIALVREYRTRMIADVVTGRLDVREAAARLPDEPEGPGALDEGALEAEDGDVPGLPDEQPEAAEG